MIGGSVCLMVQYRMLNECDIAMLDGKITK